MIRKKAAKKAKKAKKSSKRKSAPKKPKELHPAEVRQDISLMVEESAHEIAEKLIDAGKNGRVPEAKYLFEFAGIFPKPVEGEQGTPEEDSFAKTLLHRLHLPEEPIDLENPPVLGQAESANAPASVAIVPANGEETLNAEDAKDAENG